MAVSGRFHIERQPGGLTISTGVLTADPHHCQVIESLAPIPEGVVLATPENDAERRLSSLAVLWLRGHWDNDPSPAYENEILGAALVPEGS